MPKFISRNQFEVIKVLKKRGATIKAISEATGVSKGAVSRNSKYATYEDYLATMYSRRTKYQKEVEAKSGPVVVVPPASKSCSKCGKVKAIDEFDKVKVNRDGHSGMCKECRRERQRNYKKAHRDAVKANTKQPSENAKPSVKTKLDWLFKLTDEHDRRLKRIEDELDEKFHSDEPVEKEQPSEQGLEPRVGKVLNVFIEGKIRRAEIMGSREVAEFGSHEKRYLVRYKKLFGYKYADVNEAALYAD